MPCWTGSTGQGNASDLDGAVSAIRDAAAGTPTDHPSRAASLTTLGVALRERFLRTGDTADLNAASRPGKPPSPRLQLTI